MKCPTCGNPDSKVIDSRPSDKSSIRRRRECLSCGKRFTTYEIIEATPLFVIKKDGSKEIFDPNKVAAGVRRACYKRPVTEEQISEMVQEIENEAVGTLREDISTSEIGNMVMEKLRKIDEVSYVRFASVYREFKDIDSFLDELRGLCTSKKKKK
ncbi:MAG: transcriptional repressor NrdR [Clostridia bacterium]|nr:transcriptional repressor NrdR [Clostridia bacterium]